jgi:hypothetical protein
MKRWFEDEDYWDDFEDYEDAPLYQPGELAEMTEERLAKEWECQCNIHDHGVDHLPMSHSTIESAAARLHLVEIEQNRRKETP